MDYACLPHFCKKEGSGSSRHSGNGLFDNCFSLDHAFHVDLYNYVKKQAEVMDSLSPIMIKEGSFHVKFPKPNPDDVKIVEALETEFHQFEENCNGSAKPLKNVRVNGS